VRYVPNSVAALVTATADVFTWRASVATYAGPAGVYELGNTSVAGTVHVVYDTAAAAPPAALREFTVLEDVVTPVAGNHSEQALDRC